MEKFKRINTKIDGLYLIEPTTFSDNRGEFTEIYSKEAFRRIGIDKDFVQDNKSKSKKGVLRGLHFQIENTQGKLIIPISGKVFSVAVDLRKNSKTFGKWDGYEISKENKKMFYIPPYFAHGFLALSDEAEILYKCTDIYNPLCESGIIYDDKDIDIKWPEIDVELTISEKDKKLQSFKEFKQLKIWENI